MNIQNSFSMILTVLVASAGAARVPIEKLKTPKGFEISLFAQDIKDARSLALGPNNIVIVGTRSDGRVYALVPEKNLTRAQKVIEIAKHLDMPNGVAVSGSDLIVAENSRIIKFPGLFTNLESPSKPTVILDNLPKEKHHGWRYLKLGPDNWLYVGIGAPCNICLSKDKRFASISRVKTDGKQFEVYANGVRNTVGMTFDPKTRDLWFTDVGRDELGDDLPPDELNRAYKKGLHFGYPFTHGDNVRDPEFGSSKEKLGLSFTSPVKSLGSHVAALGLTIYQGKQFPKEYKGQIFIAEHGSWNRSQKVGYRVSLVKRKGNQVVSYEPFVTGWLEGEEAFGRPVDLLELPDGSLLISDDLAGAIYRLKFSDGAVSGLPK